MSSIGFKNKKTKNILTAIIEYDLQHLHLCFGTVLYNTELNASTAL